MPASKKPLVLYISPSSTPCRAVWMTCKALGLQVNVKVLNLFAREHMSPEYLKINPTHSVPALDDNGFFLWEARAIMCYLADEYGKSDELYPKDPKKRAIVNRMLFFDVAPLYYAISRWLFPQIYDQENSNPQNERQVRASLKMLDDVLRGSKSKYAAGDQMTIADFSLLATVTFLEIIDYDLGAFPHIKEWTNKLKSEMPYFEECNKGLYDWKATHKSELKNFNDGTIGADMNHV